jgi:hypothetical protein
VHPLDAPTIDVNEPLGDEDFQLALYLCYELHYASIEGVDEAWEWEPSLLSFRRDLEAVFESALRASVPNPPGGDVTETLLALAKDTSAPSLSRKLERDPSLAHFEEFMIHRSAYHLKEADPHSWAIPRLAGAAKVALVEIQTDEYGSGEPKRMHASLFAQTMRAMGLDDSYLSYLERIPGVTLATVNLVSMFGLHRRWRGAAVGHLAYFEMTSTDPNRRYGNALRALGFDGEATRFFDEHVVADAVHENIAAYDMAGGLARQEPVVAGDIIFGARCLAYLESRWGEFLASSWDTGRSTLL